MVYLDESGFNGKENFRDKGWSPRGILINDKITGKRLARKSLLLAKSGSKYYAPCVFEGTCNTEFFNAWLKQGLLPELPPRQIIIMDNASIHKGQKTRELIEKAGHILLFLPTL